MRSTFINRIVHKLRHRVTWLLLLLVCMPFGLARAAELSVPLKIPYGLMGVQLETGGVLTVPAAPAVYQESPCRSLRTEATRFELRAGKLHALSRISVEWGVPVLGHCVSPLRWRGTADLQLQPRLSKDWRLGLAVTDSALYGEDGTRAPLLGFVLELVGRFLEPRIERYGIDLAAPRREIIGLLGEGAPPANVAELKAVLDSVRLGEPRLQSDGVSLNLVLRVPARWLAAPLAPVAEAPLSEQELERRREALENLDAFLLFAVKRAGLDLNDREIRTRLFDLLIDTRYRLQEVLTGDAEADRQRGDPVRALLPKVWGELRDILADANERGLLRGRLLEYTLFLDAGDVLLALDRQAPAAGDWISANGLRHLARMLQPGMAGDPLEHGYEVDPLLREIFGFGAEPPSLPAMPRPGSEGAKPGRSDPLPPVPLRGSWLDWLIPTAAAADTGRTLVIAERLNRWVPPAARLEEYRGLVGKLLRLSADQALQDQDLKDRHAELYRNLVPATAMIESCWRQFVRKRKQVSFVRSPTGSLGLMQVNPNVWRRIYDPDKLKWDIAYNAGAGSQILMRYLRDQGLPLVKKTGEEEYLAQAAYAAYNAGPGAAGRFLKSKPSSRIRKIDQRLLRLYRGFAAGGEADLSRCVVRPAPPDHR